MDFTPSLEQQALRESVERFVQRDYGWEQRAAVVRASGDTPPQYWAAFAELGWLGAGLSEAAGGFGGGAAENAILLEAFGRGLVVEPIIAHVIAVNLLSRSTSERAAGLVAAMVMGEKRVVPACGEGAHDGPFHAGAELRDGRLYGRKTLVEGAAGADLLIVSAMRDAAMTLCLVDPAAAGVTVTSYRTLDNHRSADIVFDGVELGADASLEFSENTGDVIEAAIDHGIVALCAEAVGAMDAALMLARDYLLTRQQFGVPLGSFQALQHRMADMLIETEMARSILFQAIASVDAPAADLRRKAVSAAKVQIGAAGVMVGSNAIQLHGGIGMTEEYAVGHYYKRLYVIARSLGGVDFHTQRFAAACDRLAR